MHEVQTTGFEELGRSSPSASPAAPLVHPPLLLLLAPTGLLEAADPLALALRFPPDPLFLGAALGGVVVSLASELAHWRQRSDI